MPIMRKLVCDESSIRARTFTALMVQVSQIMNSLSHAGYEIQTVRFTVKESWFIDSYECKIRATKWVPDIETKDGYE